MQENGPRFRPDAGTLLPAPLEARAERPSLVRIGGGTGAAFVSQLLAARDRLGPQREHWRAPPEAALGAYRASAASAIRRLPKGHRKTLVV